MKQFICLFLALTLIASLAACSGADDQKQEKASASASAAPAADGADAEDTPTAPSSEGVDVDLTLMSGTMVYSEVLNMQQHPDQYLGKTVKMRGPFNVTDYQGNRYFACVIADATACCTTGIEFVWKGDHSYPDDYPKPETEITVVGTFNTYKEGNSQYLQLKDADVQF